MREVSSSNKSFTIDICLNVDFTEAFPETKIWIKVVYTGGDHRRRNGSEMEGRSEAGKRMNSIKFVPLGKLLVGDLANKCMAHTYQS